MAPLYRRAAAVAAAAAALGAAGCRAKVVCAPAGYVGEHPPFHTDPLCPGGRAAGLTAVVAGATGATGRALVARLAAEPRVGTVLALSRRDDASVDSEFGDEELFNLAGDVPSGPLQPRDKVRVVHVPDWEKLGERGEEHAPAFDRVDLAFTCMGTSRANAEVKAAMTAEGDAGFAEWLQRVDVRQNAAFARAAAAGGAKYIARVSASCADSGNAGGGFHVYCRHQGLSDDEWHRLRTEPVIQQARGAAVSVFRPGPLERGKLAREWEKKPSHADNAMAVSTLATALVTDGLRAVHDFRVAANAEQREDVARQWSGAGGDGSARVYDVDAILRLAAPGGSRADEL